MPMDEKQLPEAQVSGWTAGEVLAKQLGVPPWGWDFLPLNHRILMEILLDVPKAGPWSVDHINASSDLSRLRTLESSDNTTFS